MQIASVLSYMPYVARPSESNGVASTTSPARSSASTSATASPVVATQPTTTDDPGKTQAPTANENAALARGNESSTARTGDAGTQQAEQKGTGKSTTEDDATAPKGTNGQTLAPEDIELLKDLQARDREVRRHELAHQIVGGQFAGGASYTFERGPDGGRYAVAGEVPIDVGAIPGDPQATIEKMRKVRAAALAPAEPSAQDRAIAAQASQTLMAAQLEFALQRHEALNGENPDASTFATIQSATRESENVSPANDRESIRAVQAYEAMVAQGMNAPTADALRAMA